MSRCHGKPLKDLQAKIRTTSQIEFNKKKCLGVCCITLDRSNSPACFQDGRSCVVAIGLCITEGL